MKNRNIYRNRGKRQLWLVAAVCWCLLAAGCRGGDEGEEQSSLNSGLPITLCLDGGFAVQTRGTGTVGDALSDGNYCWRGEKLNIFMFAKDTTQNPALTLARDANGYLFNNTEISAPAAGEAKKVAQVPYGSTLYYPMGGRYDFFAYHADNAATASPALSGNKKWMLLPVTIDGTQDLMVAKACPPALQQKAMESQGIDTARCYGAYTARRSIGYDGGYDAGGIQPYFTMNHILSRLVFYATSSKSGVCDRNYFNAGQSDSVYSGVTIDSIIVISPSSGNMIVGWTRDANPASHLDGMGKPVAMPLKQRAATNGEATSLVPLVPVRPQWNWIKDRPDTVRMGESLLLCPQESYQIKVVMTQLKVIKGRVISYSFSHNQKLALKLDTQFRPGKQYKVYFTAYSLQSILLDIELVPWDYGENIYVINEL